jgi:TPR repeat protein
MSNISNDVRNYFKLELLIGRSYITLRQLFKNRYSLFTGGQIWDDSVTCGRNYSTNVIGKNKNFNLTAIQKVSVANGNSNEWDLTTLTALLLNSDRPKTLNNAQVQQLDNENKLLLELRDIRNKLVHHKSKSIVDSEFHQTWSQIETILLAFGDHKDELDKLKDNNVFDSSSQSINQENLAEALRLSSLGTQAHREQNYSDAIALFTKAIVLSGVPDQDRAILYSNISSSRLALYKQQLDSQPMLDINNPSDQRYRALQDAKQSRNLNRTWWKGHFRVGNVYAALNEHEKAINSFGRALALDPANTEIQKALDESQSILARKSRQEHLNPRTTPATMSETLNDMNQKFGTDPQQVRLMHSLLDRIDPSAADVVRGHKYEHGDIDVNQDYEQAANYFAKAAGQGNAEGMYNLARLYDRGLGVKKDHKMAFKLLQQAAAQPSQHPKSKDLPNVGVAEAEHSLGLRYAEGVVVHKNLSIAAQWYQRATDHGSAESANNLALMYEYGTGVDKNLDKAEELYELSARRGDPNAMKNLAELLINRNNLEMAKTWYDRACEAGNILAQTDREQFYSILHQKEHSQDQFPFNVLRKVNKVKTSDAPNGLIDTLTETTNNVDISKPDELFEYAERGSITAQNMCLAIVHSEQALEILEESESLTETQENEFIHELAQCYRINRTVLKISTIEMHQRFEEIIDRVLQRCNTRSNAMVSELDEDARTCYATLHMDSHQLIVQFLEPCKQKYPRSIYFFDLSAFLKRALNKYEDSLYDINTGLELDPTYCELLYQKAMLLSMLNEDLDKIIEAYQAFLAIAPKDHPEVPESYYSMAMCYLIRDKNIGSIDMATKTYELGKEAEQIQLPCFLPYQTVGKAAVEHIINKERPSIVGSIPSDNRRLRLTNPRRIEIIKSHRRWAITMSQTKNNSKYTKINTTIKPRLKQQSAKTLVGLKSISLKEMNPTKDHIYNGYVLSLTVTEETYSWTPSIHLVVEDDNLDCEQMCIYGFPPSDGKYLIQEVFKIGTKMHVINPYLRIGAYDMKPMIRVDDFSSIIMQNESENVINMCRCCGLPNALHACSRCEKARYCSKECQTMDWKLYAHKLICKN